MNLKLDSTGDLIIGRGASRVSGADYVAQLVENKLKTLKGEWELDTNLGLPWFGGILKSDPDLGTTYNWISKSILSVEDVKSIESLSLVSDKNKRKLTVEFTASTSYGGISRTTRV